MRLLLDFNVPTFSSTHVVSCFFKEAISETFNVFISLYFLTANILSLVITTTLIIRRCFLVFVFFFIHLLSC